MANYYSQFVEDFAKVARPLYKLTKKDELFDWNMEYQEAFETLKAALVTAPVLRCPDISNWGSLLNSILNMAAASLMGTNFQEFDSSLATLPASDVELPDLVLMRHQEIPHESPITSTDAPRDTEHWKFQNFFKVLVNMWGMSRQYIDILHELSIEGNGGFVEDFVATMAVEEKLSIVSMPYAEYGGRSFHCCIPDGTRYYSDWYLTGECRNYALSHPVKNDNESIWGKTQDHYDE
ncbi:hypothetical protein WJX79_010712 [Trebouxia sp. C0005]